MMLTLPDELEQFVRDEVAEGAYASDSDYVQDLVRERYRQKRHDAEAMTALDKALDLGIADAEAGRVSTADDAFARLRQELSKV